MQRRVKISCRNVFQSTLRFCEKAAVSSWKLSKIIFWKKNILNSVSFLQINWLSIKLEQLIYKLFILRHNTQHNDIKHNDTQHNSKWNTTFSITTLSTRHSIVMLSVTYAQWHLYSVSFTSPFVLSVVMLNVIMMSVMTNVLQKLQQACIVC